jgi:hypothetical protein
MRKQREFGNIKTNVRMKNDGGKIKHREKQTYIELLYNNIFSNNAAAHIRISSNKKSNKVI